MSAAARILLPPCPFLPVPEGVLTAACLVPLGSGRGAEFYETALRYAQSLWREGFPARSLLLINRALGCALTGGEPVLRSWPLPYRAVSWLLRHHQADQFIGNPRRHWQHLATRMSGPRSELRTWRAWACWWLARLELPELPADTLQLEQENIREPSPEEIEARLIQLGLPGEPGIWRSAADACGTR